MRQTPSISSGNSTKACAGRNAMNATKTSAAKRSTAIELVVNGCYASYIIADSCSQIRMSDLPLKLKNDPISEAVFEVRFTSSVLPELVVGGLAAHWKGLTAQRFPAAEIPPAIRRADPNLQFQPLMELRSTDRRMPQILLK